MSESNEINKAALASLEQALLAKSKGNLSEAEATLITLLKEYPNFAAAYNNLGTVYFAQKEWEKALTAYQAAIANQADYIDAYYNLGLTYKKLAKFEAAVLSFASLLRLSNEHFGAHFQLGSLLMLEQKYAEAMSHFEKILAVHPQHAESSINLANCHLKLGYIEKARSCYLTALAAENHDPVLYFNLGVVSYQLGQLDAAIDYYLHAISLKPGYFEAHNNLATCYLGRQQRELALQQFIQAAKIQPENEALKYTIESLSQAQISTAPPLSYVSTLFDAYAGHYDAHMLLALNYQVPDLFYRLLDKAEKLSGQKKDILDLGCGTGLCGEKLKMHAHSLHGVDISANMLARAREKGIYQELACCDIEVFLKQSKAQYQLIMAGDVVEYRGELDGLFELISNRLNSGGLFLFNTEISEQEPYIQQTSGRFAHNISYIKKMGQKNQFTPLIIETFIMREQASQQVKGHLYLLERR